MTRPTTPTDTEPTGEAGPDTGSDSVLDRQPDSAGPRGRRARRAARRDGSAGSAAGTAGEDAPGTGRPGRRSGPGGAVRLRRVIAVLAVLAVLLGAVLLVQLLRGPGKAAQLNAREDRREAARQAAATSVPKLYSYDYRRIATDVAGMAPLTTGDFTKQVTAIADPAVKSLAVKNQAVVQAVTLNSAVVDDADANNIKVLVFFDQAVTSKLLAAPRLDRYRVVATMSRVGRDWKVSGIAAL